MIMWSQKKKKLVFSVNPFRRDGVIVNQINNDNLHFCLQSDVFDVIKFLNEKN